jgi:peptidoglycan/LPS O-acetylase OafA/YrhL
MTGLAFNDPAEKRRQSGFNPYVHGARGLFAVMVFVFHIAHSGLPTFAWATGHVEIALMALQYGVELFFGISGIVIIGALARSPHLGAFAWDRATRILPVLWVSITAITALAILTHRPLGPRTGLDWFLNLFPMMPFALTPLMNPPAWSLAYEVFFYALAALAWTLRDRIGLRWLFWTIGVLLVIALPRAILMVAGVLLALRLIDGRRLGGFHRWPGLTLLLFLACWRAVPVVQAHRLTETNILGPLYIPLEAWLAAFPLMAAGGLFGTLTLVGIHEGRGLLSRMLATRPFLWLGTVSYSFYLWHPMVLAAVKRGPGMTQLLERVGPAAQLLLFAVGLPAVLIVSWASQRLIEVRFTRWLRRFGPRKPPGPVEVALAASHGSAS